MEYRFESLQPKYLTGFENLIKSSFPLQSNDSMLLINWKFLTSRDNRDAVSFVAIDANDNVVSQYSNIPIIVSYKNQNFSAMVCADMATLLEHRGNKLISTLSKKVYEKVVNDGVIVSIGYSNQLGVKVDKNAFGYGYQVVGEFTRFVKIILIYSKTKLILKLVKDFKKNFVPKNTTYFRVFKNYEYLKWRYVDKPDNRYRIFEVNENNILIGYVVLLEFRTRLYVYDIILYDNDVKIYKEVLKSIQNYSKERHIYIVVYRVLDNSFWNEVFKNENYIKKTPKKIQYYLTVKVHNNHEVSPEILKKDFWISINGDIY